jgi:excisionase family DNA binding protein
MIVSPTVDHKRPTVYTNRAYGVTLAPKVGEPLLTVRDVAQERKVAEKTVRRWIKVGWLPATKVSDQSGWRIRRSDLETLLNRKEPSPRP